MADQEPDPELSIHDVSTVIQLRQLLQKGIDVNEINAFEETPLHAALRLEKDSGLIQELVFQGGDVNAKDIWGVTPLYCAVSKRGRDYNTIKFLLEQGADIKSGKHKDDRLLDHIVMHNPKCIKLLIKYKFLRKFYTYKNFKINVLYGNERDFYKQYKRIVDLDLKPSSYKVLSEYLDNCASEFLQMRSVRLNRSLTLERFLIAKKNPLETLTDRHIVYQIINRIIKELYGDKYPIYEDLIINQIGNKNLWPVLNATIVRLRSKIEISTVFQRIFLNTDLMRIITQYLTGYEFVMLLFAYLG
ncbi:ANK_REP_REGION domain-containing protein [Trichonephila clavata]|uniref:ANK_REP_REGION domain-containing protein n=1 Tax=Trichonephila clavata TaxID=2740835 RepID=A0A8X6HLP4_TRICU|nr:ANK_REP_REGION domain-containing protein [Trichonephila clavata]